MIKGQAIKTKADPSILGGAFNVFDKPNGTYIGSLPVSNVIGFFVEETTVGGTAWTKVRLLQVLRGYTYVYIESGKIYAWAPVTEYVISSGRAGVNVRNYPSLSSGIVKKLGAGQSVGRSDGYRVGDFMLFNLTGGGYGWVHRDYVNVKTVLIPFPIENSNGPEGPVVETTPTGESTSLVIAKYARYAIFALLGVLALLLVGNYFNNRKIKQSYES